MKILNPHPQATGRITADIANEIFDYFFRGALAGNRGPREAMVCIFFDAIYKQCIADGIPANFEIDNEHRIATRLNQINFESITELQQRIAILESDRDFDHQRITDLESQLATANSALTRQAVDPNQPRTGRGNATRRAPSLRSRPKKTGAVPGNPSS